MREAVDVWVALWLAEPLPALGSLLHSASAVKSWPWPVSEELRYAKPVNPKTNLVVGPIASCGRGVSFIVMDT